MPRGKKPNYKPPNRKTKAAAGRYKGKQANKSLISGSFQHMHRRMMSDEGFMYSTNTNSLDAIAFKLSDVPNYTELTALYDFYRINKVSVKIVPKFNTNNILDSVTNSTQMIEPLVWTAIDYNDATIPTTLLEIQEYASSKVTRGSELHKRYLTPRLAVQLFDGVTPAYGEGKTHEWINCDYPDVPHYGLKICITPWDGTGIATGRLYYDLAITYYLEFKNTK